MDGVIADFVKRYREIYNMDPKEAEKYDKFKKYFHEFIVNNNFATLDLMPDAQKGLEFLRKAQVPTQILSSTANEEYYDAISKQKMIWLQTHGITFNPIFVPGKKHKKAYAAPDKILIDDTEKNITDWQHAGGIAIFHKDWDTTIAILQMYI
jgi:hypothetical protein